jgi:zinc transport system substrate-binding protein
MDPILVKEQAAVMRDALIKVDPHFESDYRQRYAAFAAELNELDIELREALAPVSGSSLFVFHPAFGYFLDRYDIEQVAIEVSGGDPSPAELEAIIERARNEGARVIFVQPEFSKSSARAVAEAINGSVVLITPLAPDYANNIRSIAEQVRDGLSR